MIKSWLKPILERNVNIQERMFRLLTGTGMAALLFMLVCGAVCGDSNLDQALMAGAIVYMGVVLQLSMKTHRINTGATWIALLLIVVFPINFFLSDGVYGGAPIWFIFCFVYISVTIWGKRKAIFLALSTAVTLLSYYLAYN